MIINLHLDLDIFMNMKLRVDKISGLHKIAKYYYGPGIHEPGTANELIMRMDKWQDLPNNLKEIVKSSCHAIYIESLAEFLPFAFCF